MRIVLSAWRLLDGTLPCTVLSQHRRKPENEMNEEMVEEVDNNMFSEEVALVETAERRVAAVETAERRAAVSYAGDDNLAAAHRVSKSSHWLSQIGSVNIDSIGSNYHLVACLYVSSYHRNYKTRGMR